MPIFQMAAYHGLLASYIPGGVGPDTFFYDTFTAGATTSLASHAPDIGTSWTLLWDSGAAVRVLQVEPTLDQLQGSGATGDYGLIYTADAVYPSANYEVQATFLTTASAITPIYLLARVADVDNMYAVRLVTGAGGAQVYKKVAGTWSTLGSAVTIADGSVVMLSVDGTAIKLYDDAAEVVSVTDSDLAAAGKAGVAHGGAAELVTSTDDTAATSMLDTFSVTDLGASGSTAVPVFIHHLRQQGIL
jgi:hypothetical protein